MKFCGPVHKSQGNISDRNRKSASTVPCEGLDEEKTTQPQRHRRREYRASLDTRSISPPSKMPPSSSNHPASTSSRRSRSTRRESLEDNDDRRLRSRSRYRKERPSKPESSGRGKSQSRFSSQHQFSDPARPFDVNGYCVVHKDVQLAKLKADGWKVLLKECPKCLAMHRQPFSRRIKDTNGKRSGSDLSGSITDKTENSTQAESLESPTHVASRRRTPRANREQEVRKLEVGSRRTVARASYSDVQEIRKSGNSFYSVDEAPEASSRRRSSHVRDHDELVVRKCNSFYSTSRDEERNRGRRNRDRIDEAEQYNDYENESYDDDASHCSRSRRDRGRNEHRGREHARSKSRARLQRSPSLGAHSHVSRSSRRSRNHRSDKYVARPKPTAICLNGVPFDKNGCCFLHPHVKLASKKLLGGWKVHHTFCRACAVESEYDDDQTALTSRSGYSSRNTSHSVYSEYSENTSKRSQSRRSRSRSRSGAESVRSFRSNFSAGSWSSNQSRKRVQKNDSFLPLDADGYCTHHPDVQLAKQGKRGEWKVLMDFCPECAEASLLIGGAPGSKSKSRSSKSHNTRRNGDESSAKSSRSNLSEKTFVEKMPFIDNDGKPGHYTGYLDMDGRPNGRGKMKYVDGKKFDGIWQEGNQIHGKVSYKKSAAGDKSRKTSGKSSGEKDRIRDRPSRSPVDG